mmetsp:Transcript_15551/g.23859  ORF Transcript_15551/g.23859 Transcript_15551/m.23859 type:complete len:94 (+) Transcript_15551:740-1021(+)
MLKLELAETVQSERSKKEKQYKQRMKSISKKDKNVKPKPHHYTPLTRPAPENIDSVPKFGGSSISARPSSSTNLAQVSQPQESFQFGAPANLK